MHPVRVVVALSSRSRRSCRARHGAGRPRPTQITGAGSTWSRSRSTSGAPTSPARASRSTTKASARRPGASSTSRTSPTSRCRRSRSNPRAATATGNVVYDEIEPAAQRPYAYLPIVAGGTSFMYHLDVNGQRVTDLQLSRARPRQDLHRRHHELERPRDHGRQRRSHASRHADHAGRALRRLGHVRAVHRVPWPSMHPTIWDPFCAEALTRHAVPGRRRCIPTSRTARRSRGSDGVANFVAAPYNNGAITYVEYGYALSAAFPVVSVLNQAGLLRAADRRERRDRAHRRRAINPDRTQVLDDVYRNPDPRTYPVSSYSYMIVPDDDRRAVHRGKGETLGRFILYFLCTGQQKAEQLGYSPLPPNLVEFGSTPREDPGRAGAPPSTSARTRRSPAAFREKRPFPQGRGEGIGAQEHVVGGRQEHRRQRFGHGRRPSDDNRDDGRCRLNGRASRWCIDRRRHGTRYHNSGSSRRPCRRPQTMSRSGSTSRSS